MLGIRILARLQLAWPAILLAAGLLVLEAGSASAADVQVTIVQPADPLSWRYEPASLTVPVGSTVTWTNQGSMPVTVTSPDGLFDSELLAPGASFSVTFDTPGTFRYFCVPYPHMKGTVIVTHSAGS
ncbi:MAG TPA: cupredoxin family copper-binding protein [Chloroflexota bacterium]|nr:cupredoxin family copper-binding protein [Chloroflexota bacterium]